MSIRCSVTELEAYRFYRDNEDAGLEDLLAQLRKQTPPTRAMEAGSAWHKALELMAWECAYCGGTGLYDCGITVASAEDQPPDLPCSVCDGAGRAAESDTVTMDGFTFRVIGNIELCLPEIRELKGEVELMTPSGLVTLVGVVDGIDAGGVRDYKLSGRFDAERYLDSLQWRAYLLMFGAQRFTYEVFTAREDERSGEWLVTAYDGLTFCAYPGLAEDVQRAVRQFAAFVAEYLPERIPQPARAG